jgi:hypothetical protein
MIRGPFLQPFMPIMHCYWGNTLFLCYMHLFLYVPISYDVWEWRACNVFAMTYPILHLTCFLRVCHAVWNIFVTWSALQFICILFTTWEWWVFVSLVPQFADDEGIACLSKLSHMLSHLMLQCLCCFLLYVNDVSTFHYSHCERGRWRPCWCCLRVAPPTSSRPCLQWPVVSLVMYFTNWHIITLEGDDVTAPRMLWLPNYKASFFCTCIDT